MITDLEIQEHDKACEDQKKIAGDGEWTVEPNRKNWRHNGLDCMIVRNPRGLHLCGYVGVEKGHPFYGKGYNELFEQDIDMDVHGGLTYSNECGGSICHQKEGEDKTWWFGFDCAHLYDLSPGYERFSERSSYDIYRSIKYVESETNRLADQLRAVVN